MNDKPILCNACDHAPFDSYKELALHIATNKKTHKNKSSQFWAKTCLTKKEYLDKKVSQKFDGRLSSSPEQLEAKRDSKYVLSGETKLVLIKCPRCQKGRRDFLPVEHVNSPVALKDGGCFVIICEGCKRHAGIH